MFKKIISRKRLILAALCTTALFSLAAGVVRPKMQSVFYPDTAPTAAAKKQLPIYCVDTKGEKKVSVSFDAAWGEGRSGSTPRQTFLTADYAAYTRHTQYRPFDCA